MITINDYFDPDIQKLIRSPIPADWPDDIEDASHDQIQNLLERSYTLDELREAVVVQFANDGKKIEIIESIDAARKKLNLIIDSAWNADIAKTDISVDLKTHNKWLSDTAKMEAESRSIPVRHVLSSPPPPVPKDLNDCVRHHQAIMALKKEAKLLEADEGSSMQYRNDRLEQIDSKMTEYTCTLEQFLNVQEQDQRAQKAPNGELTDTRHQVKASQGPAAAGEFSPKQPGPMMLPQTGIDDLARMICDLNNCFFFKQHRRYPTTKELRALAQRVCKQYDVIYNSSSRSFESGTSRSTSAKHFRERCNRYRTEAYESKSTDKKN